MNKKSTTAMPGSSLEFSQPPSPAKAFWREFPSAIRDPLAYLIRTAELGGLVMIKKNHAYLVSEPTLIKHVLQDNHPNYRKGERYQNALGPLFGSGLLTSEGDAWKRQRRMVQPAFKRERHEQFATAFQVCTQAAVEHWRLAARARTPIDIRDEMIRLTMSALMRALFGRDTGTHVESLGSSFLVAQHELKIAAAFSPVRLPAWIPTPGRVRFGKALSEIDTFIARLVDERRKLGPNDSDIVSTLIYAQDEETGAPMSDLQLRDEIVTLLAAGHDTVAEALTWTLYLLSIHQDVQQRLQTELDAQASEGTDGVSDATHTPYLDMVLQESMRLYPPIWGFLRTAIGQDRIGGCSIPAGARVIISPYVVHRSRQIWERPDDFWPEHFSEKHAAERHRFAFFPFSAGPRQCIGGGFATLEIRIMSAGLLRAFNLQLVAGQAIRPLPRVSLKPDRSIMVNVSERDTPSVRA